MVEITIDGHVCPIEESRTIMDAAYAGGVYIPAICHHPSLPPFENIALAERVHRGDTVTENEAADAGVITALEGCGLCVVSVDGGEPVRACCTTVTAGMTVTTEGEDLRRLRRERLSDILARHPHACITCAQREGCSLEDCSSNTAREDRCCPQFHNCELRKVSEYVGVPENTLYTEVLNSDSELYWGSNVGNAGAVRAEDISFNQWRYSIAITLPPLGMLAFKPQRG